jgi:hypothetical protein
MPFKSSKQRKWMHANKPKMAKKWEKEEKSVEEDRDYKDEYKKFQSSDKAKKYRSELNQYNRKKGTYGNGDGKDASHKGGKIVGFEKESTNRGRAEKSRLKKEAISKDEWAQYPKYARKLKPYMKKLLKIPVKVRVIKQANHNPWIDVRVARFGKDVIPNDFRKRALKAIGGGKPRDMDNISYGNINAWAVSMKHDQWLKLLGNKVKSEMLNPPNYLDNQAPTPINSPEDENLVNRGKRYKKNESVNEGNFDRGTSGLPKGFTDDYYKIVKKLSKGKGYLTLSKSDKKKVWATLGKIYTESVSEGGPGSGKPAKDSSKDKEEMERKAKEQAKKDMEDEFDFDFDESVNEAKFTDDTLVTRLKHWSKQHKGTGIGYGHVLGHLAVHMKEMGWNKSYKEVARIAVELGHKKTVESANEAVIAGSQIVKAPTSKLVKIYKQMADERLSSGAALTFRLIAKELIKRKAKLEGGKDCCDNCKEGKPCCSVESVKRRFSESHMKGGGMSKVNLVNESTKRQYRDVYSKYYKTYEAFAREVMNLTKRISKISGDKVDAKIILKNFKKHVIPFAGLMNSWSKGRESNPHIDEGFGSPELMGKKDLAEFEKTRQKNAEVLGYKLTGQTDIKPIKEKSKVTK